MDAPTSIVEPKFVLKKREQEFQFFAESLGDGVAPLEMMVIPAGKFKMGSPEGKGYEDERPQHQVTVGQFFMAKTPVTQAQWRVVAEMTQVKLELQPEPSKFEGENRPVERVSWHEAMEFCARLSVHTGRTYTLPSEAQWEYACRAKTTTPFYFGETITTEVANYNGNSTYDPGPKGEYREETTPVDFFAIANPFGLWDMHGNVWEWCLDHWHKSYEGAPTTGNAWLFSGNKKEATRVLRGGSWYNNPAYCRSAYRYYYDPVFRLNSVGFRVVCLPQGS